MCHHRSDSVLSEGMPEAGIPSKNERCCSIGLSETLASNRQCYTAYTAQPPCQTFLFWPSAAGMGYLRHAHSRNDATCRLDNAFTEANSREQPCKAEQRLVSRGLSLDVYTAECRAPEKPVVLYNVTSRTIVEPIGDMTVAPLLSLLTSTRYICRRSRLACKSGASVVRVCSS